MVVDARMAQLEDLIRRPRVIDTSTAGEAGVAALGSLVVIEDLDSGAIHTYELAGAHQEFGRTAVSAASPMGQALLGAAAGAELTVELPGGRSRSIRLISVDAA
jgi:transcription elongation factor GreA